MEDDQSEMVFKVVLVGDVSVGKTNIVSRYIRNEFHEDSKSTVGVEFLSKQFQVEGHSIKAQIWDTAGSEKFRSITNQYYKGAKGALVVYDITNQSSFESVDKWMSEVSASADKNITFIIIGNKCDLNDNRKVTTEQGEDKAMINEAAFMETSALSGENIEKAFELMINEIYKKNFNEMAKARDNEKLGNSKDLSDFNEKNDTRNKKKCC